MKRLKELLGFVVLWLMMLWVAGSREARCETVAGEADWYVVKIAGTPVGAASESSSVEGETLVSSQTMDIVLNRLGTSVKMGTTVAVREDSSGGLLEVEQELRMSTQATSLRAVVEPGRIRIVDRAGDGSFEREIEYEGKLLGPTGAVKLSRQLQAIGDQVSYRTFRAELGSVSKVSLELVAHESLTREGEAIAVRKVIERLEATPLETSLWIDRDGRLLRSAVVGPFGLMEVVGSDEAAARLAMGGGELPEESFASTLVPTQVRVREPRTAARVVLELRHRNPDLGWPAMDSAHQRVVESTPDRLVLEVRRPAAVDATRYPVEPTEELRPYLAPNAYLQSDDPELRALAVEIAGGEGDALEAGLALERWVAENMRFDMGVVMAPSNEVLANRRGTCTEYAVLLTTLTRALGIPARFVMGYVYAGGIYGGHAWTEILVGKEWVPLDGAIVSDGPADAARFAFQWTSLEEGVGALNLGPGVQLFGQIDLAVLEVGRRDGVVERFGAEQSAFEIDGDLYVNRALGLVWRKPADFEFAELEITWPETALVRLGGPDGERAELSVRDRYYWLGDQEAATEAIRRSLPGAAIREVGGPSSRAWRADDSGRATLAWTRASELWTLTVRSDQPAADLDRLAAALEFEAELEAVAAAGL